MKKAPTNPAEPFGYFMREDVQRMREPSGPQDQRSFFAWTATTLRRDSRMRTG